MSDWVFKWEKRDWKKSGKPLSLANRSIFELQAVVAELNALGAEVLFWLVLRGQNGRAQRLANDDIKMALFRAKE
jgi:hypothetical protein